MALKPASLQWADAGTFKSADFGDIYFQAGLGAEESSYVFLEQNRLPARFQNLPPDGVFNIAELGFGSGLNFLLTVRLFMEKAPKTARLFYASIEKHPIDRADLAKIYTTWPDLRTYGECVLRQYPPLIEGFHHIFLEGGRIHIMLLLGDVADTLPQLAGKFDAWYLDGFAPAKNPAMWSKDVFLQIAARTKPAGTLSSFSAAGHVRQNLTAAGFEVEKAKGFGVKRDMTIAALPGNDSQKKIGVKTAAVIGAGIAGCAAAYALAKRGYSVTLLERHQTIAAETSGNPAAIVYSKLMLEPSFLGQLYLYGFCFTRTLVDTLQLSSWNPCGVLHLDIDEETRARTADIIERNGYPADFAAALDRRRAGDVAGISLNASVLYQPLGGYLSPFEFCAALIRHEKINTVYGAHIDAMERNERGWTLFENGHKVAAADVVVIATGYDSLKLQDWLPLQALRGQVSYLPATPLSRKIKTVICHDGYIIPAIEDVHSIGATFQREEPGYSVLRPEDHAKNLEKLNRYVPGLGFDAPTGGRTGYRVTTPDKAPLIGPCPDYEKFKTVFAPLRDGVAMSSGEGCYQDGLYLTTGFGAHGMVGAPLAGEMIAAAIAGEVSPIPQDLATALLPARFILRDLKRRKI